MQAVFSSFDLETSSRYYVGCNRLRPEPTAWQCGAQGTPVNHRCGCRPHNWARSRRNSDSADCLAADCFWNLASPSQWLRRHSPAVGSYKRSSNPSFMQSSRSTTPLSPHNAPEESSKMGIGLIFITHQPLPHHHRRAPRPVGSNRQYSATPIPA